MDPMKGDRVEAVVDTGQGVQTFEIVATRAGRRIEVTSGRGIVEVTEVTRGGNPVRTGRFMASRLIALVEHPAIEGDDSHVDVTTRRRLGTEGADTRRRGVRRANDPGTGRVPRRAPVAGSVLPAPMISDPGQISIPESAGSPDADEDASSDGTWEGSQRTGGR